MTTTNNNKKSNNNLLEAIDQMIEDECGISSCSFEISHKLREVRKLIIAYQQRIMKELEALTGADKFGIRFVTLRQLETIVTEGKEQGDSDKQE